MECTVSINALAKIALQMKSVLFFLVVVVVASLLHCIC